MKVFKGLCVVLGLICLVSCATSEKYARLLNKMLGLTEEELVMALGVPTKTYTTENLKVLEYFGSSQYYVSSPDYQVTKFHNMDGTNIGSAGRWVDNGYYKTYSCRTSFFLKEGKVDSYKFLGNGCIAY